MYINSATIGSELSGIRNKKGISLNEMARNIGIHPNTLAKYEKDASDMQLATLEKILKYFEIDELIFFKVIREYVHAKSSVENDS